MNPTDLGGNKNHHLGFLDREKLFNFLLIDQIDLINRASNQVGISVPFKRAPDSAADEAQMTCDVHFRITIHKIPVCWM